MIRFKSAALASAALALSLGGFALAQEEAEQPKPPRQEWSFAGIFGRYDQAQLQRGFQVYLFHQEAGLGRGPLTSGVPASLSTPAVSRSFACLTDYKL
jgi:hypothetical protein